MVQSARIRVGGPHEADAAAGLPSVTFAALAAPAPPLAAQDDALTPQRLAPVRKYIKEGWTTLTRSSRDLIRAAPDPEAAPARPASPGRSTSRPREDRARVEKTLAALLTPEQRRRSTCACCPRTRCSVKEHGLLYLPHPYVVPGGRFNEMYGWDSYFIQVGLLRDGEVEKARELVGQLRLRDRPLRHDPEREPHVLPEPLAAAVPDPDDPGRLREDEGPRVAAKPRWPAVEKYYAFWTTEPHLRARDGPFALLRPRRGSRRPRW